jgi:hypothetical protein
MLGECCDLDPLIVRGLSPRIILKFSLNAKFTFKPRLNREISKAGCNDFKRLRCWLPDTFFEFWQCRAENATTGFE